MNHDAPQQLVRSDDPPLGQLMQDMGFLLELIRDGFSSLHLTTLMRYADGQDTCAKNT